jgi:hypothetical protein
VETNSATSFQTAKFNEYLEKYGAKWVSYKKDSSGQISVKLKTFEEYRPLFEEKDKFLVMQAEELSDEYKGKPIHIGAINVREVIKPQGGNSVAEVMQNDLDANLCTTDKDRTTYVSSFKSSQF